MEGADAARRRPRRSELASRSASMTRAGSQPFGQRAVQVSQVRHSQIDSSASSSSRLSSGHEAHHVVGRSGVSGAIGQPAEHLPHW